jgi:hypothetical protein
MLLKLGVRLQPDRGGSRVGSTQARGRQIVAKSVPSVRHEGGVRPLAAVSHSARSSPSKPTGPPLTPRVCGRATRAYFLFDLTIAYSGLSSDLGFVGSGSDHPGLKIDLARYARKLRRRRASTLWIGVAVGCFFGALGILAITVSTAPDHDAGVIALAIPAAFLIMALMQGRIQLIVAVNIDRAALTLITDRGATLTLSWVSPLFEVAIADHSECPALHSTFERSTIWLQLPSNRLVWCGMSKADAQVIVRAARDCGMSLSVQQVTPGRGHIVQQTRITAPAGPALNLATGV